MRSAIKAYVINLDRSPDRLSFMRENLERVGLDFERVDAVEGSKLKPHELVGIDSNGYQHQHGKEISMTEIGCYLSHVKAISTFLEGDATFGLILEDDTQFSPEFGEVLDALVKNKEAWDVVKLSGRHSGTPIPLVKLNEDYRLTALLTRHTEAAAYLVNRFAAQRYIEKLLPMTVPYDHAFDRAWKFGFRFRAVTPMPAFGQQMGASTIAVKDTTKRAFWLQGGKLAYRTQNEVSRVLHYISRGLFIPRCSWPPKKNS